jgi:spore coat polysaccharide biosynthesis protein SpsF
MNICIIQARLTSSRLPNKVLMSIKNKTIIEHIYDRLALCRKLDKIVFAIPDNSKNDNLAIKLAALRYEYYRGSEDDVLDRYYVGATKYYADIVVRVTSDCPFIDYNTVDDIIEFMQDTGYDYVSREGLPIGVTSEAFTFEALAYAHHKAKENYQREHVVPFMIERTDIFNNFMLSTAPEINRPNYRLTLDTMEDYILIRKLYEHLYNGKPIPILDLIKYLDNNQHLLAINKHIRQKSYLE